MNTVQCEQGHHWQTDCRETVACCPVCGGAPTLVTGMVGPATPENGNPRLLADRPDHDPLLADQPTLGIADDGHAALGDQTLGLPEEAPHPEDEATLGLDPQEYLERAPDDQTLGLPGEAPPAAAPQEQTLGLPEVDVGQEHTLGLPAEAPPVAQTDQTLGNSEGQLAKEVLGDHTLGLLPASGDNQATMGLEAGSGARSEPTQGNVGNERTGAWDTGAPVRPPTHLQEPEKTTPIGAAPAVSAVSQSTGKPAGKKKSKKDPLAGKTSIKGYEILGELGRGGMGVVYKARQPGANRLVALKMVLNSGRAAGEALQRFKLEAEAVAQLQHPNIVQLYEVGEDDGCPFFSLEFIDGDSLSKKIENTPQPAKDAAQILQKLSEAMYLAHQRGIIHRDLKPANILLTKDGTPKITDFGLAKRFEDKGDGQTRDGAIMGTPSYMAPEQAQGRTKDTGPAADIYSLGAILYDMLTGRPPFRGTTLLETLQQVQSVEPVPPMRLQPSLPADLQTICLKALEKDPLKRYQTAGELAEDLRRFQADEPILARPTPWYERSWKWARRNPSLAGLYGSVAMIIVSLLVFGGLWLDSERRAAEVESQAADARAAQQKELALQAEALADSARANEALAKKGERDQAAARKKEEALRKVAEENFNLAQKNFKRAKKAVDEMLSEVGQDRLKKIPQMEKVRRDLLKKARVFYDEFMQEKTNDPDIRLESALAQQRVADIMVMLGDPISALRAYDSALTLFQGLENEDHNNLRYKSALANVAGNFGNVLKDIKRNQDAEKHYRYSLKLRKTLHDKNPQSASLALELAKSHNNLGTVLSVLGREGDAVAEFQEGRKLLAKVVLKPGGSVYQAELAKTLNNLGTLQKNLGPPELAEKSYREANKILDELVGKEPEVPEHRQDLAQNHLLLADLLRDTDAKTAEAHYLKSIALRETLAKDFPSTPAYQQEVARGYSGLAILLQAASKQKEADEAYAKALAIQQKIVKDFPNLPDYRRSLAASFNDRGVMLLSSKRVKDGEAALIQARDLFSKLNSDYPDVPEYEMELAGTYLNLGTVWLANGKSKEAQAAVRQALDVRLQLVKKHPGMAAYQEELARTQGNLGLMLLNQRPQEAEALFREAAGIFERLAKDNPKNPDLRLQLAISHHNQGNAQRLLNKLKEAESEWRASIQLYQGLVADFPDIPAYAQDLGKRYNELGIFLVGAKRPQDAEKAWQEARAVQQKLVGRFPDRIEYRTDLGRSEGNLGILFAQTGNFELAEKQYRKAIAFLEEYQPKLTVTAAYPGYIGELVTVHVNLANLLGALNKPGEAEKSLLRVVELREALAQKFPQVSQFRLEAVGTLNDLGNRVLQKEKFEDAKTFYAKAVDHLRELTKEPAVAPEMWTNLYLMQLNLATSFVGLKDHAGAAQTIRTLAPETRPKDRHDEIAAGLLARCVALAEADNTLSSGKGKDLAKTYTEQALALLRQAVANGFRDSESLRKNDDFQAIRGSEDFQKILKDIPAAR